MIGTYSAFCMLVCTVGRVRVRVYMGRDYRLTPGILLHIILSALSV